MVRGTPRSPKVYLLKNLVLKKYSYFNEQRYTEKCIFKHSVVQNYKMDEIVTQ